MSSPVRRRPTKEQQRARVHMLDPRHVGRDIALCGTFSSRGHTTDWRDVTCQHCLRHRQPVDGWLARVLRRLLR